ncbi:hypothetical protein D3C85_1341570 [compost metagenome]
MCVHKILCCIFLSIRLLNSVYFRAIVPLRLQVPQFIALFTKRLARIRPHANIDNGRFTIHIDDKITNIIMVVTFGIMPSFNRYKHSFSTPSDRTHGQYLQLLK